MKMMESNSIDFIITDPPYGLKFMSKKWDYDLPSIEIWKEALRICKPGTMMAAFGGSRTHHRLMCSIEDAGWEIRDVIMWIYGSGFPKSLDVSKAIDKTKGEKREILGPKIYGDGKECHFVSQEAMNLSAGKCQSGKTTHNPNTSPASDLAKTFSGYGTALKPSYEPIILCMKPLDGTFVQNAEKWGVGGLNIDKGRIEGHVPSTIQGQSSHQGEIYGNDQRELRKFEAHDMGRWPANTIFDEEAAAALDEMSGILKSGSIEPHHKFNLEQKSTLGKYKAKTGISMRGDSGGASRFFYCAKASTAERNAGLEDNNPHPTVKPLSLMSYLIKLLAPPGDPLLLDPFAGSGSTLVAAKQLGIRAIGIEMNEEYCEIAGKRIAAAEIIEKDKLYHQVIE